MEAVRTVMVSNVEKVLERGEKVDDLVERANTLQQVVTP